MFIAFDGIDGAGKTSIYESVAEKLRKNHKVKLFDMGNLGFLDNIIRGIKKVLLNAMQNYANVYIILRGIFLATESQSNI